MSELSSATRAIRVRRTPGFGRTLLTLFRKELTQNALLMGFTALALLIAYLMIFALTRNIEVRVGLSMLLFLVPLGVACFKPFWQLRTEYGQNTHYLLRALPASGLALMLAKYLWLVLEVAILGAVLLVLFLFMAVFSYGLDGIDFPPLTLLQSLELAGKALLVAALCLLPFPALALCASMLGRLASRYETLAIFGAYLGLGGLYAWLLFRLSLLKLDWPGITPSESLQQALEMRSGASVPGDYILLQVVLSALLMAVSAWMFERQDV
ncbi:putative integral membrane protein [Deinobacterium chartae]|uniref:Putative integral membrane protein n=1 Tax=Deinobacterium chartae TaxID=521158 RepID=A0A841HZJ5_9DEIO|nr:hypothetical protein [Deinobacterium chartae]MBB6098817.1 putative integral membrane protein [Deinobacterium chartae]